MILRAVDVEPRACPVWPRAGRAVLHAGVMAVVVSVAMTARISSADDDAPGLPPAPGNRILDTTRLFAFRPDLEADLSQALWRAMEESGFDAWVAAYSHLPPGETADNRAARLVRSWTKGDDGLVVVYVRSTNQLTFGSPAGMVDSLTLPVCRSIYGRAVEEARAVSSPPERVHVAALAAIREAGNALNSIRSGRRGILDITIAGIAMILAACLALFAMWWFFARIEKSVEDRVHRVCFFPRVRTGSSLGGKFGGGVFAEIDFRGPTSPEGSPGRDSD